MQRTFVMGPYSVPSRVLTAATRAGLRLANLLEAGNPRVRRSFDVPYGAHARQRLDVHAPAQACGDAPVVVFLHGGNWTYFGREDFRYVGAAFAERGLVAVVPSYRRYPEATLDAQLLDAARALRWARAHAAAHGGDPRRLLLFGHSSGAHLAALLALDARRLAAVGGAPGWLAGWAGLGGPYAFATASNPHMRRFFGPRGCDTDAQPLRFAGPGAPPALLLHGAADRMVRPRGSRELAARLAAAGVEARLELLPGDGHATALERWVRPRRGAAEPVLDALLAFADARRPAAPGVPERCPALRPSTAPAIMPAPVAAGLPP